MCRHVAYVGPPVPLDTVIAHGEHSLVHQAHLPRELLTGVVCADGWGVGWYAEDGTPARYRSAMPIWSDANLPEIGPAVRSRVIVAMVRNATPGMPFGEAVVHPLRHDRWLFIHNGSIRDPDGGFRASLRRDAPSCVPEVPSDTGDLFRAVMGAVLAGASAEEALREVVERTRASGVPAWLNLLLTDGEGVWATRWAAEGPHPSLYVESRGEAVRVASEPVDAGAWRQVPPSSLVAVDRSPAVRIAPL